MSMPVPSGAAYVPPPRPDRTWVRALVVLAVVLVVAAAVVVGCSVVLVRTGVDALRPRFDVGNGYLGSLARGDTDAAAAWRCDRSGAAATRDLRRLQEAGWTGAVDLNGTSTEAAATTVDGTVGVARGSAPVTLTLAPIGAGWCVTSMSLTSPARRTAG